MAGTLQIPKEATIAACEAALLELMNADLTDQLRIPTNLKYLSGGSEMSWVQFLITWAQSDNAMFVRTYAQSPTDDQIERFSRRLYGLVASLSGNPILGASGEADLTGAFRAAALQQLEKLQSKDPLLATRGPAVEVVAADHLSRSSPVFLYRQNRLGWRELRPRDHFVRLAEYLLEKTVLLESNIVTDPRVAGSIGNLLYETFKNTEDHALHTVDGDRLNLSFRLLQASRINPDEDLLESISSDYPPFSSFFSRHKPRSGRKQIPFFTVSVLDSGPGFAQTWTGEKLMEMSIKEEVDATVACFSEGTRKNHHRYGQGLPLVRSIIREYGGFMRLRTGRLSLFYDAQEDNVAVDNGMPLKRWPGKGLEQLAPVSGTLLTVVLPIETTR